MSLQIHAKSKILNLLFYAKYLLPVHLQTADHRSPSNASCSSRSAVAFSDSDSSTTTTIWLSELTWICWSSRSSWKDLCFSTCVFTVSRSDPIGPLVSITFSALVSQLASSCSWSCCSFISSWCNLDHRSWRKITIKENCIYTIERVALSKLFLRPLL